MPEKEHRPAGKPLLAGAIIVAFLAGLLVGYLLSMRPDQEPQTTTLDFGGGTVTILPDAKTFFELGVITSTVTNEQITTELLPTGTTYTSVPDGSIVTQYLSGTTITLFADGQVEAQAAQDGDPEVEIERPTITEGEDKKIGTFNDGTIIWLWDNGDVSTFYPPDADGIRYNQKKWADGVKVISCRAPNGDREVTIHYPDGSRSVIDKNGHTKHYDKNGNLKWEDGG